MYHGQLENREWYCACVSVTVADCFETNQKRVGCTQGNLRRTEYFWIFGLILYVPIIHILCYSSGNYVLQAVKIRFTALSCSETNIYLHVFL